MKKYVLYHGNCYDGFGAAWAAFQALGAAGVRYLPVTHGRPVPSVEKGSVVYLLDFSYPRTELIALAREMDSIIVIDHHVTAREALDGISEDESNISATFNMEKSGAILAWEHFFPDAKAPDLLFYVQDRDLWAFELPKSKEVSAALRSYPMKFDTWNELDVRTLAAEGTAIVRHTDMMVQMICSQAAVGRVGGVTCVVVNSTAFWSEVGNKLLEIWTEAPFSASWYRDKWGDVIWSLRGRGDYDVGALAKSLGGGGHHDAAGFTVRGKDKGDQVYPWTEIGT